MGEEIRVEDATTAQLAAKRYLEAHNPGRIADIKISKVWYRTGKSMDVWEVEGLVTLRKGFMKKEQRPFRFQINPNTGDVIGYEA